MAAVAFDFNGALQGACAVPRGPLHVFTHVDTRSDHVELRKPSLEEAPPSNFDALKNALLEVGPDTVTWFLQSEDLGGSFSESMALPLFFSSLGTEACDVVVALQDICDFEPLHVRDQSQRAPDAASTEAALPRAGLSLHAHRTQNELDGRMCDTHTIHAKIRANKGNFSEAAITN